MCANLFQIFSQTLRLFIAKKSQMNCPKKCESALCFLIVVEYESSRMWICRTCITNHDDDDEKREIRVNTLHSNLF